MAGKLAGEMEKVKGAKGGKLAHGLDRKLTNSLDKRNLAHGLESGKLANTRCSLEVGANEK